MVCLFILIFDSSLYRVKTENDESFSSQGNEFDEYFTSEENRVKNNHSGLELLVCRVDSDITMLRNPKPIACRHKL
jgi:hypothetical protein